MTTDVVPTNGPAPLSNADGPVAQAAVVKAGGPATRRFWEFFAGQIPNPNTRDAYLRAAFDFFGWLEGRGVVDLLAIEPLHVAAYVQDLRGRYAVPTVKQRLAALRMLFDWLVIGQVIPVNPAASVRGPKHVVTKGKTPVLDPSEARQLLDSISDRAARSGADRRVAIQLCPHRRGAFDGHRGCLQSGTAALAAAA